MAMSYAEKAERFAKLHIKGAPFVLYNAWDAGSAKVILEAGAQAIATSSWAVAEAQGYRDGESIPRELVERVVAQIVSTIDAPVSVDFEGGYAEDEASLSANVARLLDIGAVGINFEDRVVKGEGLYDIEHQARRIAAIRAIAERKSLAFFINARTDLFLGQRDDPARAVDEALVRAKAYRDAGASGFFVPGVKDEVHIGRICEGVELPVNVIVMDGVPTATRLRTLGVARISYGALPYIDAMSAFKDNASEALR